MAGELVSIAELCPSGIAAGGFGVLALDLAAVVAVQGSEPGIVKVFLAGAAQPLRLSASASDRSRAPAHELAEAIRAAANAAKAAATRARLRGEALTGGCGAC